jgi:hypothetical protein
MLGDFSVSRSTSVASSGSDVVVYFGNAGSFTFNPLANWPIVVLQGNAVLGTYGVIIIWALILGAIVWGISIFGQYSGFFSGKFHSPYKLDLIIFIRSYENIFKDEIPIFANFTSVSKVVMQPVKDKIKQNLGSN